MYRWNSVCERGLRSKGLHISVNSPVVYISTADQSIEAFTFEPATTDGSHPARFHPKFTDGQARPLNHHLTLPLPSAVTLDATTTTQLSLNGGHNGNHSSSSLELVLICDKYRSVTGLLQLPYQTLQKAAPTLFEASLPRAVTRLKRANLRPLWRQRPTDYQSKTPTSSLPSLPTTIPPLRTGVLVDDIIGATSDGTIYTFSVVDLNALNLLTFLDLLLKRTDPHQSSRWSRSHGPSTLLSSFHLPLSLDPATPLLKLSELEPQHKWNHVDGDNLEQLLHPNATTLLHSLLSRLEEDALDHFGMLVAGLFGTNVFVTSITPLSGSSEDVPVIKMEDSLHTAAPPHPTSKRFFRFSDGQPHRSDDVMDTEDEATEETGPQYEDAVKLVLRWLNVLLEVF